MNKQDGWIGVDLDGTLARDDSSPSYDPRAIGDPIPLMVRNVKRWIAEGWDVRIFTARVSGSRDGISTLEIRALISNWCARHIGCALPITCEKDYRMIALFDDRAYRVERNTGAVHGGSPVL